MSDLQDTDLERDDGQTEELSAEQLKEQLAKKEEDIQFLKGKWGEEKSQFQREIDAIKNQYAQVEGRISEQREMFNSSKEPARDPYELDEETMEKYRDDPAQLISFFKERESELKNGQSEIVDLVVAAMREQESTWKTEFGTIRKEIDPEIQAWKPAISKLRENDALKDLDEKQLIEIAKMQNMKPVMEYRGDAGGQRGRESTGKPKPFDPSSTAGALLLKMFNGNEERAKSAWEKHEAKKGL